MLAKAEQAGGRRTVRYAGSVSDAVATIHIRPPRRRISLGLGEVWQSRELVVFLAWKAVKVRYKQTALGFGWAVLQPFMTMVVFSFAFGKLGKIPSEGVPYPVFSYAALVPWYLFANTMTQAGTSLVANANMLQKVYFPRLVLPLSTVLSGLVDFVIAFAVLLAIMACYGIYPQGWEVLTLPLFLLLAIVTALGVGTALAGLNARFRDVQYVLPFVAQLWLFATPVAYPSSLLSSTWQTIYGLNPMAGVVEGFRWALLGTSAPTSLALVSVGIATLMLIGGLVYFRRAQGSLADII